MYRYTRTDFDRVLEFVRGLYEPRTPDGLRDHLVSALRALVPAAFAADASFEVGDPRQGRTQRTDPPEFAAPELDAALARHAAESPIVVHFERTRREQFTRWSDIQPTSQFLRSALYNEVYRPARVRDCCTLFLRSRPDRLEYVGVGLHKQIPDAHRDMLVSVSPHVIQAFRLAHATSALIEMAATKSDANRTERGLLAIDLNGTITNGKPPARHERSRSFSPSEPGTVCRSSLMNGFRSQTRRFERPPTFQKRPGILLCRTRWRPLDCPSTFEARAEFPDTRRAPDG